MKIVQVSESEFSVQGHGVHTAFVETCGALQAAGIDVIKNGFGRADARHIHTVGPYSLAQLLFGSGHKVVSAHVVPDSFVGSLVGAKYWLGLAKAYLRWFYNRAELVLAVSDQTKTELESLGVTSRIEVLHNMIDTSRYSSRIPQKAELRKRLGIATDAQVVIGNGQIQPRKRFDTFLAIAHELPEVTFVWVGGMPFGKVAASQAEMQHLIDTAPENVVVTGVVSLDTVADYFAASDVFVMTSEQETFGLAIVEAAASGLPVVLRDIRDYDATFRADAVMCDESTFAQKIRTLLTDSGEYEKWQQRAAKIATRYSSKTVVTALIDLYKTLGVK